MILLPIKNLANAKQRLAPVLNQTDRTQLAHAMLRDILETLAGWRKMPVSLVTSDSFAIYLAGEFGFDVIIDYANISETDAIERATGLCESRQIESTLVIPGDIPLIEAAELDEILSAAPEKGSVLVPASDRRGTNAALRRPAGLFPLRFGNDSFQPHYAAARTTEQPCVVLSLSGIALDIDQPADLVELAQAPGERSSQQLVRQWGFLELPKAANE
ncbi:MAG: 2-phospho-L-lactate guanylyltransferase [Acidobacteria bacterium]|nr:2-phospho-L-lactate guanylyltransferase [Acidobacteriota bacterium]